MDLPLKYLQLSFLTSPWPTVMFQIHSFLLSLGV